MRHLESGEAVSSSFKKLKAARSLLVNGMKSEQSAASQAIQRLIPGYVSRGASAKESQSCQTLLRIYNCQHKQTQTRLRSALLLRG